MRELKRAHLTGFRPFKELPMDAEEDAGGRPPPPEMPPLQEIRDVVPPEVRQLTNLLEGDQQLAERILSRQLEFPMASIPELITREWLLAERIPHTFQGSLFGGRPVHGGAVADFVIPRGGNAMVWRVQGTYWHTRPGVQEKDLAQKLRLLGGEFNGMKITEVVDIWEEDIYRNRPGVFHRALAGIGMRG